MSFLRNFPIIFFDSFFHRAAYEPLHDLLMDSRETVGRVSLMDMFNELMQSWG